MICPKCQSQNDDSANFCGACAHRLNAPVGAPSALEQHVESRPVEGVHSDRQAEEDAFVGKVINNKYYIKKRIAAGGMGVVYLATQKGVGQDVAIKKLHSTLYRNREVVERFINEARSYGRITHPNAVKLYDLLNVNGELCIIMEFVHGRTLTQYVEERFIFSQRQIVSICLQLADALDTVHRAGIIHRDLKTENVMLLETSPGRFSVKILDFGIAKMMDTPPDKATEEGLVFGTPEFMSPEQCYGVGVDARSDIYAFGVLMYVMIACQLPFTATSKVALMHMQVGDTPPPLKRPDNSELNTSLVAIVSRCMEKKADDRYQTFADVITDLTCIQEGRETSFVKAAGVAVAAQSTKAAKPKPRKSGFSLGVGFEDEDRDPSMHLLEGIDEELDESGEYQKGDMSFDTEFEERAFSLGSFGGLNGDDEDEDEDELDAPQNRQMRSVAPKIIAIVLLIVLISGASVYLYWHPNFEHFLGLNTYLTETFKFKKEAPKQEVAVIGEAVDMVGVNDVADGGGAAGEPLDIPVFEPEVAVEIAAAPDISRLVFERGIARASLDKANALSLAAEIAQANDLLRQVEKQKDALNENDSARLEEVKTQNIQFETWLADAEKSRKDGKCSEISKSLQALPAEAKGVSESLQKLSKRCNAYLAAPPTTL